MNDPGIPFASSADTDEPLGKRHSSLAWIAYWIGGLTTVLHLLIYLGIKSGPIDDSSLLVFIVWLLWPLISIVGLVGGFLGFVASVFRSLRGWPALVGLLGAIPSAYVLYLRAAY